MKDPTRLADVHPSEVARAVLRSANADAPLQGALGRTLAATGVSAGGAAAASAKIGAAALVRWVGIALLGVALVVAGAAYMRRGQARPRAASTVSVPPAPTATQQPATEATAAAAPLAMAATPVATTPAATTATPRHPAASSLEVQIAAMDHARASLTAGDASGSLRALDKYDRDFPRGAFAQEANVLRVEALTASGDLAAARALATRLLAANPNSPYARRIRAVTGAPPSNP